MSAPEHKDIANSFFQPTFIAKDKFDCSKFNISIAMSLKQFLSCTALVLNVHCIASVAN